MSSNRGDGDGKEDDWLREHQKQYQKKDWGRKRRNRGLHRAPIRQPSSVMMKCSSCGLDAPRETVKRRKCMACQALEYLENL